MERQQESKEEIHLSSGSDDDDNIPDVATCQVSLRGVWGTGEGVQWCGSVQERQSGLRYVILISTDC